MQTQTVTITKSIENNVTKAGAKTIIRINSKINSYKEFKRTKDVIRYLQLNGNKCLRKKI
jgi:hypothetical protein